MRSICSREKIFAERK